MIKNIVVIIAILSAVGNAGLIGWNLVDQNYLAAIFHLLSVMYLGYLIDLITDYTR